MTTLIIARHGNTFGPGDTVTYVGGRTDLPLVEKGVEQAKALGRYLKDNRLIPDVVYSSLLKRTQETARIAVKKAARVESDTLYGTTDSTVTADEKSFDGFVENLLHPQRLISANLN
ncbi:MAG: histidine phosphatase family protein, partial [Alphaproteobacteria bacterium]|nr:histidine phosphatase family protein [Alphaproteobacteria bacterium]